MQVKNSVVGGRRSRKPKAQPVVPNPGPLVALRALLREAWAGSVLNLLAFSGHAVPGRGVWTLHAFHRRVVVHQASHWHGAYLSSCVVVPNYHLLSFGFCTPTLGKKLGMIYLFHLSGSLKCLLPLSKRFDKTNASECVSTCELLLSEALSPF